MATEDSSDDTGDTPLAQPQAALTVAAPVPFSSEQAWLASRLLNRQVVNATTLEPVGRVSDVLFDPRSCHITALIVQATATAVGAGVGRGLLNAARRAVRLQRTVGSLGIDHIIALNGDVVMADSDPVVPAVLPAPEAKHAPEREACLLRDVCELTIITLHGMCLGVLADLLLDARGTVVTGYAVTPTRYSESVLRQLEESGPAEAEPPLQTERGASVGASAEASAGVGAAGAPPVASPPSESSATHVWFIPASPRVRIGESLILVVEEVEPLRQDEVIITSQPARERLRPSNARGVQWRWATRPTRR
jgi:sporulation protein YlmC with PRC-barrel domain